MALKIKLRPNEQIIVNGAVIRAGEHTGELVFLNHARVLHQKDILREGQIRMLEVAGGAPRPDSWLYYLIQLIYIDPENVGAYLERLQPIVMDLRGTFPDKNGDLDGIIGLLADGEAFKALKACRSAFRDCLSPKRVSFEDAPEDEVKDQGV